jgi:hypothetical protein
MTPRLLGLIRGLRAASFDALAIVLEQEIEAMDKENATLRAHLEALTDAVVIEGSDPCSFRVRTMTNRALDYLIILDEKDLEGEIPRA